MDDDMPDFQDDTEKEDLLLGDEDDIEAGLQAAFDEEEAHEAPSSGGWWSGGPSSQAAALLGSSAAWHTILA